MAVKKTGRAVKPVQDTPISVEIDVSKFVIGDMLIDGQTKTQDFVRFLERVVVGGVKDIPLTSYRAVVDAVLLKVDELKNPK